MSKSRRVLITGASGFVGVHAVAALQAHGFEVHAVARRHGPDAKGGIHWYVADLLAPGEAERVARQIGATHLLHLAWNAVPGRFWTAPDNLDWVAASLGLYRGFIAGGGQRAVNVGTCAEYDWSHNLLDERDTPCAPRTLYGTTKNALHDMLRNAARQDGISFAWARLFFLFGPFERPGRLVPDVIRALLADCPAPCGEGLVERDFMHVADVANALAALLTSTVTGPVNIASGTCVPLREVLRLIAEQIGRPDLIRLGARPSPPCDPPRLAAATEILKNEVGFTPRYNLADGLAATIEWWQERMR